MDSIFVIPQEAGLQGGKMLKPLRGYVLVEQIDDTEVLSSGLVLPETAKDKPIKGVVLEVGDPALLGTGEYQKVGDNVATLTKFVHHELPISVKEGDKVVYKKWSTTDLEEDGKKLSFVAFQDILGVYE